MQFTLINSVQDFVDFYKYTLNAKKWTSFQVLLPVVVGALLLISGTVNLLFAKPSTQWSLYLQIILGLMFIFPKYIFNSLIIYFYKIQYNRILKKVKPVTVKITNQGIGFYSDTSSSQVKWDGFEKFILQPENIFLYNSNSCAYIIPKRCFKQNKDWLQLQDIIKKHLKQL